MLDFLINTPKRVRPHYEFKWTDERVERLKTLWKKGFSGAQIAAELGCSSRNAVCGKIDRLRRSEFGASLAARSKAPAHRKGRSDTGGGTVTSIEARGGALSAIRRNKQMPLMAAVKNIDYVPDDSTLCLFLELAHGQCRYPLDRDGQRWFCGAPQFEPDSPLNSYCAFHHRLTHQPIDRSKIRSTFQYHA